MPEYPGSRRLCRGNQLPRQVNRGRGHQHHRVRGPTRKGPFRATADDQEVPGCSPASGDFERIYGGITDLALTGTRPVPTTSPTRCGLFNGGRLAAPWRGRSAPGPRRPAARSPPTAPRRPRAVHFVSRFRAALGNGQVVVREQLAPVAATAMANAPAGTFARHRSGGTTAYHPQVGNDWHPAVTRPPPPRTQRRWRPTPRASSPAGGGDRRMTATT